MLIHKIENRLEEEKYVDKYLEMLQNTADRIDKEMSQIFKKGNIDGDWSNAEMAKYNRKKKLKKQIRQEIKQYRKDFTSEMRDDLASLYKNESLFTQDVLKQQLSMDPGKFDTLPTRAVKSEVVDAVEIKGKTLSDYIQKYSTDLDFRIEQEMFESIALGENPRKTTRRLDDIYDKMAKNRVDMTTRSWQNAIYNQSNLDVYEQGGLKKVRNLATLDEWTCPICAADHNKVYIIGEQPSNPRHPRCRCSYSPYIDSERTEPANSYEGWLQDGRRSPKQLEGIKDQIKSYMNRGRIKKKEGQHLLGVIGAAMKKVS